MRVGIELELYELQWRIFDSTAFFLIGIMLIAVLADYNSTIASTCNSAWNN